MKYLPVLLLGACLAAAATAAGADEAPAFRVRFGVLQANQDGSHSLATETTDLLRKFQDTGYRWGFELSTSEANLPYTYYSVIRLPAPPDQVTGDLAKANPDKPSTTVTTVSRKGTHTVTIGLFWFDPGDPVGEWRIDVFVNGELARSIKFRVRNE